MPATEQEREMAIKTSYVAIGATILVAIGVASCDSRERTAVQPSTGPTTVTPVPSLARVDLIAPGSIAPGESVQLTANAVKSDNSVENVSGQAEWISSDPRVVEISSTGVAKGITGGEAVISVSYKGRSSSTRTFVLPAGTYRLSGTVTDSGLVVVGATVAVIGGVGEGLSTITDGNGTYALYGVRDRVRLHAKVDGYFNRIEEIDVTDHRTFNFEMIPDHQRPDLPGRYTLTIARTACLSWAGAPPESRSYEATVAQDGPRLTVTLSGADFIVTGGRGNSFTGVLDGSNRVTFTIGDPLYYYQYYDFGHYDLVERISNTSSLLISGKVTAGLSSRGMSGTLNGAFMVTQAAVPPASTRIQAYCYGTAHRFEMVRR
jgi:hypothetical protein